MYFENFIQNDKMIKYLFDQDIVITVKFFNKEHMHESSLTRSMCVGNTFASECITDD